MLGRAAFFSLGNSNGLATVDLAGAYAGVQAFALPTVGAALFVATLWGPLCAHSVLLDCLAGVPPRSGAALAAVARQTLTRLWALTVYAVAMLAMRHHLFVWTVFAPRMLYDVAFAVDGVLEALVLGLAGTL